MIVVDDLFPTFIKSQDFYRLADHGLTFKRSAGDIFNKPENYLVCWGDNSYKVKHSVMETGFFKDALHLDTIGLYEKASFNFGGAKKIIENFSAQKSWKDLNLSSKFSQPESHQSWDGVVIACQYFNDRSIWRVGSSADYHNFLEDACKFYGKRAFLKRHPVTLGNKTEQSLIESLALKYGCETGHVGASILNKAESVVVYNSTYAVDALMAGKHVMQYAPGYFWQSDVVQYTSKSFTSSIKEINRDYADKFLDFLLWKYCFHNQLSLKDVAEIIKTFSYSKELFPLPEKFSYAAFI